MRNQTELMGAILTNEMAQTIIDYVSPIYGNSYVGLWIFQAIGTVLEEIYNLANDLKKETNPVTSTLLLDYWEAHYGLSKDSTMTPEQRRSRIITKIRNRGACSPARLATAVSDALGGVGVDITENVTPNKFIVSIRENVPSLEPAIAVIEKMKPAHLIYEIVIGQQSTLTAEMKTANAITHAEVFTIYTAD